MSPSLYLIKEFLIQTASLTSDVGISEYALSQQFHKLLTTPVLFSVPLLTPIYTTANVSQLDLILFLIYTNIRYRKPTCSRYLNTKMEIREKNEPCCCRYSVLSAGNGFMNYKRPFVEGPESEGTGRATKREKFCLEVKELAVQTGFSVLATCLRFLPYLSYDA